MTVPKTNRIPQYVTHRVAGVDAMTAARLAGYAEGGIAVTVSRLESREDVRRAIRNAKRGTKPKLAPLPVDADDDDDGTDPLRKRLNPWKLKTKYDSPLDLMLDVMNNPKAPVGIRIQCAKDAMPYVHARKEGGKKEERQNKAEKTAKSTKTFGTMPMPNRPLQPTQAH